MADGPYRSTALAAPEPPAVPAGIMFRCSDDELVIEVRAALAAPLAAAGGLVGGGLFFAYHQPLFSLAVVGGLWLAKVLLPMATWRWQHTTIDMREDRARLIQRGIAGERRLTIPLADLSLPQIGSFPIKISRRMELDYPCLVFQHWPDGVVGGQTVSIQLLVGYGAWRLGWLRDQISRWMVKARERP